jgi:hypothetical protein
MISDVVYYTLVNVGAASAARLALPLRAAGGIVFRATC